MHSTIGPYNVQRMRLIIDTWTRTILNAEILTYVLLTGSRTKCKSIFQFKLSTSINALYVSKHIKLF